MIVYFYVLDITKQISIDAQNIYYFFSTAAQSIAAFIAFLISGYALVYQAMDNLENRDETLSEVHYQIKQDYYSKIKVTSIVTAVAILGCLSILFLNPYENSVKNHLIIITTILILISICMSIGFVIFIINPNKIKETARKLLTKEFDSRGMTVDEGEYIKIFIKLERTIRELIKNKDLTYFISNSKGMFLGYKVMVNALMKYELIDKDFYYELLDIGKYRNLIVHGEESAVDEKMYRRTKLALETVENIK